MGRAMGTKQEYDLYVRRLHPASVAGFAVFMLFCFCTAQAQVHGVPTSVTSIGFGGHFDRVPGIPPSVTSLGPRGFNDPGHTFSAVGVQPHPGQSHPAHPGQASHHPGRSNFPLVGGVYAVPYYVPAYVDPTEDDNSAPESTYPSGPTIFDRRASGQTSQDAEAAYAERILTEPQGEPTQQRIPRPSASAAADAAPVPEQPATVLVFKDGRQLEVQNYAIVGATLFDLTPGHRSRIALADLDLASTAKQNDDRGVIFQVPATTATN
jgi:hypothetical protein